jgi:hypothetical protein
MVPALRREVRAFDRLEPPEIERLLASRWHEEWLFALLILVRRYERGASAALRAFLARHAPVLSRTMLRYAIERFPRSERQEWLVVPGRTRRRRGVP